MKHLKLNIQLGSFKTEILYLNTGSLQPTAPLPLAYKDFRLPWLLSPHGEEGRCDGKNSIGIMWAQKMGEGRPGKSQGELTQGQTPRQGLLAYVLTNQMTVGPEIASPQGLHFFPSPNYVALLEIPPFRAASWQRLAVGGGKALLGCMVRGNCN